VAGTANRHRVLTAAGAALLVLAGGCGPQPAPSSPPSSSTRSAGAPHVMVIVEENHGYDEVIGNSQLPFINSLARQYGSAANWFDLSHPSLPNYLGLMSGSTWGSNSDSTPQDATYAGPSFVDELARGGIGWRAYIEDMPRACDLSDQFGPGHYDVNHVPFLYFDSIRGDPARCGQVVPYGALSTDLSSGRAPPFMWVSPNLIHDMHDGTNAQADGWLGGLLQEVMGSPWWSQGGVVVLTWDESESGEQIATIVVSARLRHATLTNRGDHYGTLRGLEELYGVGLLGASASPSHGDLLPLLR
jgi:hypothetical protein